MAKKVSPEEALIYMMVTMSAADRAMTDNELRRIGGIVQRLPVFRGFDIERLVAVAEDCGEILNDDDGLDEVLRVITQSLPARLYDTAYALAVDVAAADLDVGQEELRLLQIVRDRLGLDPLVCAAIERGARARFRTL
ncbi:tellurite resistance protein TerB [Tepidamorphus gemmatus]|uniref:Tellurite resistance protein TerB n=1 Tax=Tepidamorphus gemmatus TaxID=747076 RepID=A0A4R3MML1_9HYPH|nr:tellurite resistance TerB family protein [Tepidamorphus gemmatus]TCT13226.1 tellurite resistance protein TerB [Tepidamorphus gemmatus]